MSDHSDDAGADRYPHLAPELRRLSGDVLDLWGSRAERRSALEAIVTAWEAGSPDLDAAVARVDTAIVEGLRVLDLPRGPVRSTQFAVFGRMWIGRKTPDCDLLLDAEHVKRLVSGLDEMDSVFRTWVHESLHARQRYDLAAGHDHAGHRGYEEGLVAALADLIVHGKAGMHPAESAYTGFTAAYRTLAVVAEIDVELLWRTLWTHPTGQVRSAFVRAVDDLRQAMTQQVLTVGQRRRLLAIADHQFRSAQAGAHPDERSLIALWRTAFR